MRKLTQLMMLLLVAVFPLTGWAQTDTDNGYFKTTLINSGDYDAKWWRIPGVEAAADGSVVAVFDKRYGSRTDLPNPLSVVSMRSEDNGATWSEPVFVAERSSYIPYPYAYADGYHTYGDPAIVLDTVTNELICMFVGDQGFFQSSPSARAVVYYSKSSDNGVTWSDPVSINDYIYTNNSDWHAAFAASGGGLQLENGRLMFVLCVRSSSSTSGYVENWTIYSDDHGDTWQLSNNYATASGNEAKVVEVGTDTVLMSIRNPATGMRRFCKSTDGGKTWGESYLSETLKDANCNGDILRYNYNGQRYLLHSLNNSSSQRRDVSIFVSQDDGDSWSLARQLVDGPAAYSSLAILKDGTLGCLIEEGHDGAFGTDSAFNIVYHHFTMDWLLEGLGEETAGEAATGTLVCNGNDRYMSIADHDDFDMPAIASNQYTISFRVKKASETTTSERFMGKRANGGNGWELWGVTSAHDFAVNTTPSYSLPGGKSTYFTYGEEWNHVCWVFDGPSKKSYYYINGNLSSETTITYNSTSTTSLENDLDVLVGCGYAFGSTSASFPFEGEIDDVHFYKAALTAEQVVTDMDAFNVTDAQSLSLVAAYDFESISGTTVPDISGNGHTGTLHGYSVSEKYQTPSGTTHSGGNTYVERIYSEDAITNIDTTWSSAPSEVYQLLEDKIEVQQGSTFTLNLDAYSLGAESYSTVRQDLRYTCAVVFSDWDSDGTFTQEQVYGSNPPSDNTAGNMAVMEIAHTFTVPADAAPGECRIRVIYNNAWKDLPTANSSIIVEGMAYDIVVNVTSSLTSESFAVSYGEAENGTFEIQKEGVAISSGDEILYGTTLTVVSTPAEGYRLGSISVNGSDITGTSFVVRSATEVTVTFEPIEYCTPTFTNSTASNRYMTSITSSGDITALNYTNSSYPGNEYYVVLDDVLDVQQGATFSLTFNAYNPNQDNDDGIRYTHAEIYADWNGDGEFIDENQYADATGEWVAKIGNESALSTSMGTITQSFTVPEDAHLGLTRIRILYTDAWHVNGDGGCTRTHDPCAVVHKGMVYDIQLNITNTPVEPTIVAVTVVNEGNATLSAVNEETGEPIDWTAVETGTVVNLSVTAPEGQEVASVTFNGVEASYNEGTYDFIVNAAGELVITLQEEETFTFEDFNQPTFTSGYENANCGKIVEITTTGTRNNFTYGPKSNDDDRTGITFGYASPDHDITAEAGATIKFSMQIHTTYGHIAMFTGSNNDDMQRILLCGNDGVWPTEIAAFNNKLLYVEDGLGADNAHESGTLPSLKIPGGAAIGSEYLVRVIFFIPSSTTESDTNWTFDGSYAEGYNYDFKVTVVDIDNSINELEDDNSQLYYANGEIRTNLEGEIFVYDLSGKLVKRAQSAPVNVADLANGVYIVRVNGETMKFVK